jgi:hypothetical protein
LSFRNRISLFDSDHAKNIPQKLLRHFSSSLSSAREGKGAGMRSSPKAKETNQERLERVTALAIELQSRTDCPLMSEKIKTLMEGKSVNH